MTNFALIDGNSFYASCETVFRPDLKQRPIIVLSNNDGCVVTRNKAAKALGIKMGQPFFQVKHYVEKHGLVVFSSNYELYADLSSRMMETIGSLVPQIETYSIDECFAVFPDRESPAKLGAEIRNRIMQWIGITTCVGVGPTKTLAKFCNHLAKQYDVFKGVVVWNDFSEAIQHRALKSQAVDEVWGVGRRIKARLNAMGINTAYDLCAADSALVRKHFGVTLERTQRELQGFPCDGLHATSESRQGIVCSRSFSELVTRLDTLKSAVTHHVDAAVGKLRQQNSCCKLIEVFIATNPYRQQDKQYYGHKSYVLPTPSADTLVINKLALKLLQEVYRPHINYKKCGVELGMITPNNTFHQTDLLSQQEEIRREAVMSSLEKIRDKYGKRALVIGSKNPKCAQWHMKTEFISPRYTTRLDETLIVN